MKTMWQRRRFAAAGVGLLLSGASTWGARAHAAQGSAAATAAKAAPGANALPASPFTVLVNRQLQAPDIALMSMSRRKSTLAKELDAAEPVVLNFIFTTCATICSTQTATLAALQQQLRGAARPARFMTFTIDPDNDTPEQLAKFARQFGVGAGWDFFTGKFDDLLRQQQAFDVYRGAKANHLPVVMMRRDRTSPWVRIEGHPSPTELRDVYDKLPRA
jgi:protein SCO1